MVLITPDINQEEAIKGLTEAVSYLELFPGKEKVHVVFADDTKDEYELKQRVSVELDLLELLYSIKGLEVKLT